MDLYFLGPLGSHSHKAAMKIESLFENINLIPTRNFYEIYESLDEVSSKSKLAILPVENSTEGSVTSVLDYLASTDNINIVYEMVLNIKHSLYSNLSSLEEIDRIYSHSQAIGQCRSFFKKYPHINLIPVSSTAKAAEILRDNPHKKIGAISSPYAQDIYGLSLLEENIGDNRYNQTRFLLLSNNYKKIDNPYFKELKKKSSIIFAFEKDQAGSLLKALEIFAARDINLSKLESRPAKEALGNYIFYIDFPGDVKEDDIKSALNSLSKITKWLKVLGSYYMESYLDI